MVRCPPRPPATLPASSPALPSTLIERLFVRIPALPNPLPPGAANIDGFSSSINSGPPTCPLREITEPPYALYLSTNRFVMLRVSSAPWLSPPAALAALHY